MKTIGLIATALFITSAAFAQSQETKNDHGIVVRTTAKSETDNETTKGKSVSAVASSNSHKLISEDKINRAEARKARKAAHKAAKEARKLEQTTRKEALKSKKEEDKLSENKDEFKANAEADNAELKKQKADVKAQRKDLRDAHKSEMKARKEGLKTKVEKVHKDHTVKASAHAKGSAKVKTNHPNSPKKIHSGASKHHK